MGQAIAYYICRSRLQVQMSVDELEDFYLTRAKRNEVNEITGFLALHEGYFYHFFEGPVEACDTLYEAIIDNPIHRDCQTLGSGISYQRRFSEWNMSFMRSTEKHLPQIGPCRTGIGRYLKYANAEEVLNHLQDLAHGTFLLDDPKLDHAVRTGAEITRDPVSAPK